MVRENSNSFNIKEINNKHYIGVWCNGNTTDFGSVIRGSNPLAPTTWC